jgi:N-acetylglucosaminyldiphosphoundecaprenol N-acetyl-beta-D-mannosaminyltransferase
MSTTADRAASRCRLAGIEIDSVTEQQAVAHIIEALADGRGGWVATPNIDICRLVRSEPALARLMSTAPLVVPDGMPLIWAARLLGYPLAERVTGASLIFTLSEAAADEGRSVFFLGGAPGTPEAAGAVLANRYPGLIVAGGYAPPLGFDESPEGLAAVQAKLVDVGPDIVYVGLGFPKQELLIAHLAPALPNTWFVACGAAIPFAAGALRRAPLWMQQAGLEWVHRLVAEPRRLFGRYVGHDLPFALVLLAAASAQRTRSTFNRARSGPAALRRHRVSRSMSPCCASLMSP